MKKMNPVFLSFSVVFFGLANINCQGSTPNEVIVTKSEQRNLQSVASNPIINSDNSTPIINPDQLINFIKNKQNKYVRKSYSENDCFTDVDLKNFKANKIPAKVVSELRTDKRFLQLIEEIKKISVEEREKLFANGLKTFANTWAENGRIDSTGQTDAGQEAQKLICAAIVNLTKQLVSAA
jgi:hypothetical protein